MKRFVCAFLLVVIALHCHSAVAANRGSIVEKCGDMDFEYNPNTGLKLSVFGVPVIKSSSLWVVSPDWAKQKYYPYLDREMLNSAVIEDYRGGKKITIFHKTSDKYDCAFEGVQTFILLPDNTMQVELKYRYMKDEPVNIEWKAAEINAYTIIGKPFSAEFPDHSIKGTVPLFAEKSEIHDAMLADNFKSVKIDSLFGPVEFLADPEDSISLFDYRKNRWAKADNPYFWFGALSRIIEYNKEYNVGYTIKFPKEYKGATGKKITSDIKVIEEAVARTAFTGFNHIIPTPKKIKYTNDKLPLTSETKIIIGDSKSAGIENTLGFFLKDLKDLYGIEPEVIRKEIPAGKLPKGCILFGNSTDYHMTTEICWVEGLSIPEHKEGYALVVNKHLACVSSTTDAGLFNGMTTLLQLCKLDKGGLYFKGAMVEDYPSLDVRAVHCLSGKDAGDEISKAIRTLMARFKMNTLIWECQYIIWDSHPELEHPRYGMMKSEARKVIKAAEENNIEIIPLVQSLGHSEWIFTGGRNLDIAEDPEKPYAYCPTNPRTYDFIFSVYQEAVDFFKPRIFHIGHDEVSLTGRFPHRSLSSGKSATELIMEDTKKLYDWFKEKDIRIMLWGDMFLHIDEGLDYSFASSVEEAVERRSRLPKDAYIADWHYNDKAPEKYLSTKLWVDSGYDILGAGWYKPVNIQNQNLACIDFGANGYIQTTWAGFNFKVDDNLESWFQYWAYITAAHYSWSGDKTPVNELPFNPAHVFKRLWQEEKPSLDEEKGFCLDLSSVYNRKLSDDDSRGGWLGLGSEIDFSKFPTGEIVLDRTKFLVKKNGNGEAAVLLSGILNPEGDFPQSVTININPQDASELHFLMNCSISTEKDTRVGEISVQYEDGTEDGFPLVYGKNIYAYNELKIGGDPMIAWRGQSKDESYLRNWDIVWDNPNPEKKIRAITVGSMATETAPVLFAITGIR